MEKEIWRDVKGYEGLYEVSNYGNINRLVKHNGAHKPRKTRLDRYGYKVLTLWKNGVAKHFTVHRLVALAFIPNPDNLPCINHKDENRTNNFVENLEWCTVEYNTNYGERNRKLGDAHRNHLSKSKKVMCVETGEVFPSACEVERQTGIHSPQIRNCCKHPHYTARGLHWTLV